MHKITVICSSHRENGLCNADELLKILQAMAPDCVFEETSPSNIDFYNTSTLEGHAVTRYRRFGPLERVQVDCYDLPPDLFAETQQVFDFVEQISDEYLALREHSDNGTRQLGFAYLNSPAFHRLMAQIVEIEEKIINDSGDQRLIRGLNRWLAVTQRREMEMIRTIYEYSSAHTFYNGIFLVGAAHKSGVVTAIEKHAATAPNPVEWRFYEG